jgi:hypothetical protein
MNNQYQYKVENKRYFWFLSDEQKYPVALLTISKNVTVEVLLIT